MKNLLTKYSETMKSRLFSYLFFLCFLTPLLWADYTDRMKARLPDVLSAKDAGTVGEGVDGFLHLRQSSNSEAAELVNLENTDRKELFKDLATKTGGDVSAVARKFSQGIATKAKKGHWFKKTSGNWVQK
tara:strand:- start:2259 stop:2648 length:390 start_codon:yes stop_codon:yes gene_type:complete